MKLLFLEHTKKMMAGALTWDQSLGESDRKPKGADELRNWISEVLSYDFLDHKLIYPLSTRSRTDRVINNEKLEFLGDAVLSVVVAEKLLTANPFGNPINFARSKYSSLVSNAFLQSRAEALALKEVAPTLQIRNLKNRRSADALEAIIGAVYLDGGYLKVVNVVEKILGKASFSLDDPDKKTSIHYNATLDSIEQKADPNNFVSVAYTFSDPRLIQAALTPFRKDADQVCPVHDRLHWLGQRLLSLHISELLFMSHPDLQEGELTELRNRYKNDEALAFVARYKGFPGRPIDSPNIRTYVQDNQFLASVFEALTGAIYLDGGIEHSRGFVSEALFETEGRDISQPPHTKLYIEPAITAV